MLEYGGNPYTTECSKLLDNSNQLKTPSCPRRDQRGERELCGGRGGSHLVLREEEGQTSLQDEEIPPPRTEGKGYDENNTVNTILSKPSSQE